MSLEPTDRNDDPFAPPEVPTEVCCLHCGQTYNSSLIEWRVSTDSHGREQGFWCCPVPDCGGVGFGCDILPTDPTYQDQYGGWIQDSEEEDEDVDDSFWEEEADDPVDEDIFPPTDPHPPHSRNGSHRHHDDDIPF